MVFLQPPQILCGSGWAPINKISQMNTKMATMIPEFEKIACLIPAVFLAGEGMEEGSEGEILHEC